MDTKKINQFKKVSYFCLTLLSAALPLTTEAMDSLLRDDVERSTARRSEIVPQQSESLFDKFRLLFQSDDTGEDESQGDDPRQRYTDLKNKVIDKYEKERPGLARFREPIKREEKSSNLVSESKDFLGGARKLREAMEQENEDLKKGGETAIKALGYAGEAILDDKVKDPEAKGFFLNLLDKAKDQALSFINR